MIDVFSLWQVNGDHLDAFLMKSLYDDRGHVSSSHDHSLRDQAPRTEPLMGRVVNELDGAHPQGADRPVPGCAGERRFMVKNRKRNEPLERYNCVEMVSQAQTAGDLGQVDDAALVERFKRGDMAAYERLFDRYSARIYNYTYRLTGNSEVAEDLTQEAFLRAFTQVWKLKRKVNFSAWIYRVATNLCHDHFRRRARSEQARGKYGRWQMIAGNANTPEQQLLEREQATQMAEALSRLPVNYRTVLLLKYVEGMSYQQIGAILSLSEAAVTSLLHRARTDLRRLCGFRGMGGQPHAMS